MCVSGVCDVALCASAGDKPCLIVQAKFGANTLCFHRGTRDAIGQGLRLRARFDEAVPGDCLLLTLPWRLRAGARHARRCRVSPAPVQLPVGESSIKEHVDIC